MKRGLTLLVLVLLSLLAGMGSARAAGETITVDDSIPWSTLDPQADVGYIRSNEIHFITCEGLYAYPDASGSAGMAAQPDVAAGPPTVSLDGLTYTFTVRRGLKFSDGSAVTAQSFADAIARLQGAVGVGSGQAALASDIASATAAGNQLTIVLSATPTSSLLDRLALPAFCPVPSGTPATTTAPDTNPTDGPYYIAAADGGSPAGTWTISQNPNYQGSRIRNLGTFVWHYGVAPATAVSETLAETGTTADFAPSVQPDPSLDTNYGPGSVAAADGHQQYYVNPSPVLFSVVFNTRSGHPLHDPQTRLEVACAIDRSAFTAAVAGAAATPFDHFIPGGFPGSSEPSPDPCAGVGAPPSGLALNGFYRANGALGPTAASELQSELAGKGVTLTNTFATSTTNYFNQMPGLATWDVTVTGWGSASADPGVYLSPLFRTGGSENWAGFSDPTIDSGLDSAGAMPLGPARDAAFASLDAQIVAAAPMVAEYLSPRADLFSARLGCQVYQPLYGMNLNLLCVRVADTSVPAGGTVSTGTDATPAAPLQTGVTTPDGGSVSIQQGVTTTSTSGYSLLSQQLVITAPPATAAAPLRLTFKLDASALDGADPSTVAVFRDGAVIPDCADQTGAASPDPCVLSRTPLTGGDVQIVVLTSHASTWNFALLTAPEFAAATIDRIEELGLPWWTTRSLVRPLGAFQAHTGRRACLDLALFKLAVRIQTGWMIPAAAADELLADAAQMKALAGC